MIAFSEGTSGPQGYLTMFGGRLMDSLEVHPHQYFIIVMGGALVAAFIIGQLPQLRDWMKNQWAGAIPQGDKTAF